MEEKTVLFQKGGSVHLYLSDKEDRAVWNAARNLAEDIERVCSCRTVIHSTEGKDASKPEEKGIRIATLAVWECEREKTDDPFREAGKAALLPDTSLLRDAAGKVRWEGFLHKLSEDMLYVIGSDRRGAIYGMYELSEMIGVSPWYFWADVPPKRKDSFSLPKDYGKADWPSVPYRGVFLNDEEELEAWAVRHTGDGTIGPEAYRKIYELILRLKGNYLWPAMHVNYFNEDPENRRLADEAGMIVGTSHCDMMMRSNQNEWQPWIQEKKYENVKYDYSISGENRRILQEYWRESVQMYRDYEATYTVGMRGIHDSGFVTERIDQAENLTQEEKQREKVRLLGKVIDDQRRILKEVLGEQKGSDVIQTFIPYKEVLPLYDDGLNLPEDITLMWVDDNFGYVRRYPDAEERKRSGGNGLYYHASYWAPPGLSYLFFNSIPLAHTGNELKKCYESGIRKIWVLNIGAIKPLELDMEFFLKYGWEAGKESGDTKDADLFVKNWFDRNFTGGLGGEAAEIYGRSAQLTNVCKPEHMRSDKFSLTAYGDEAQKRMLALKGLLERADAVYEKLPPEERDAYYELLYMKLEASYLINASFYYADRSRLSFNRGAMQAADEYLSLSRQMDAGKRRMLYYYNHKLKGGKWEDILTPESFLPPPTVLYPAAKPALIIGEPGLGTAADKEGLSFSYYGDREKYVDVYNKGCGSVSVEVTVPDWMEASVSTAAVRTDLRIWFRVRGGQEALWKTGAEGRVLMKGSLGESFTVPVCMQPRQEPDSTLPVPCYMEAEGCVSMPADGFCRRTDGAGGTWRVIPGIGRGEGAAVEAASSAENTTGCPAKDGAAPAAEAALEYAFYLQSEGAFLLEIYRFLTLNSTGRVRFLAAVDGMPYIPVESPAVDEWKGNWEEAVMNNGEKLYVRLPYLERGLHRLRIGMLDGYVTLTKLVIYTEKRIASNLGPAFSACWNGERFLQSQEEKDGQDAAKKEPFGNRDIFCRDRMQEVYEALAGEVPPLPMLYADPDFWTVNRLYLRSDERPEKPGRRKYQPDEAGRKDVLAGFRPGPFAERDGRIMIEAEYALANTGNAYLTPAFENENCCFTHTQAETDGGTGLAMMIEGEGLLWEDASQAPGLHYRIRVQYPGRYHIWLLIKFEDAKSDACVLGLDGKLQACGEQFGGGNLFSYGMMQRWNWQAIADMELSEGMHLFSIMGRKSGLRIDRIYITAGEEWPPTDEQWDEMGQKQAADNG